MSIKYLFLETRPQFLLLSPILVFLGMAMAMYQGSFSWVYFLLSVIGLTLLHTSVNVLNDYSDHKTGIDFKTKRTPFSGGSGFLTIGKVNPEAALKLGLGSFFLAVPIGVYLVIKEVGIFCRYSWSDRFLCFGTPATSPKLEEAYRKFPQGSGSALCRY